jgi:hypothetical protein
MERQTHYCPLAAGPPDALNHDALRPAVGATLAKLHRVGRVWKDDGYPNHTPG